ncbi:ATP-binding cassette domain-containing protein [Nocardioides marmotae]|uniref:ATP-binding cassette domain-containing protein n=1 Tax=Nocardioides marmotae TaxID=2663857 RepID=A0A6I3J1K4_9ACTN|nr:ATP-binding cassette domain-containing protein [Nocardioides marmotae]MCR6031302.1 ATP-binding cassette domain-containing protein [Gordonia jinghuaiqii]MBC9733679.1 ATP-binding cassette domain-containing protein [Nocardioides marmotae]MTB84782.1 ATP-binding cassette domain-containing protein [Nocardioides marmotae]MTB94941.1 ATP-binding cassette domain-containing protein [Nocardioides marmotae]QKE02548.1 ATP-binding cassette domain-containing protein [Nocardioides marmotae]
MTVTTPTAAERGTPPTQPGAGGSPQLPESRVVDWRRLRSRVAAAALVALFIAALGQALGTVVAGRLAAEPSNRLVLLLALCVVGAAVLDSAARVVWSGVVDRAEGRLRADLLDAALAQPLARLDDQAVGEVLDRVDDDTYEVGTLVRRQVWDTLRTLFATVPMWVIAGLTWWPAWLLLPAVSAVTILVVRPLLPEISRRKVLEEMAWTDHAAALEEGVAGRDDLRTSLGQAHVVRRVAELSAEIHRRLGSVLVVEMRLARRAGLLLHGLLAAVVVSGVALTSSDSMSVARLVTLFLVTSTFVGQINNLAQHLPELQAGLGALIRLRQMLESPPEPAGGRPVPEGPLDLRFRDLHFAYEEGRFALEGVDLLVPAGETCALVGRTGSGKSTLAALVSRAVEPEPGTVLLGGVDVLDLDLQQLRATVGVVTQRTEILAGTLAENIALFGDVPAGRVEAALAELGLESWVAGLPQGVDTPLGPGGTTLSAGEEQLVAFARLLVRDVRVVVLDEATARMDPVTEELVVRAADRLLARRTGLLVAHRLGTVERAGLVAVLDQGHVVQQGRHADLATAPGRFRDLLRSGDGDHEAAPALARTAPDPDPDPDPAAAPAPEPGPAPTAVGGTRRTGAPPERPEVGDGPSLSRGILHALVLHPRWGLAGVLLFLVGSLTGAFGVLTGWAWGRLVADLTEGRTPTALTAVVVVSLLLAPLALAAAFSRYPQWWVAVLLRTRMAVLIGQTQQRRLSRTPPGEVVARTMDADRYARYADRWVDFSTGLVIVVATSVAGGSLLAGGVLLAVMVASALASSFGRPLAGRSAAAASRARAGFGRSLVSVLDCVRTVKLAAATPAVRRHLARVDSGRVDAAVHEHRVQAALDGVPVVVVQCGVVAAWAVLVAGHWDLATALLVSSAVNGFDWFGRVAGSVITEAPGTRSWQRATSRLAGGTDLMTLPPGVDLVSGVAPGPAPTPRVPLRRLELRGVDAIHDDGTRGVTGVDLDVDAGDLVLLLGQVGSGKSSLLAALAGLVDHTGAIRWNGRDVEDPEVFLRPGQVAHVAQVPRVLSGTFADNVVLDHTVERGLDAAVADARLGRDLEDAGGPRALVGHRGVRLSGGQVQRLALARALATDAELLLADDVSSALDAATELELWDALRARGTTVVGATSKRAALARADRVVVLVDGRVAASGPWSELAEAWGHLAG